MRIRDRLNDVAEGLAAEFTAVAARFPGNEAEFRDRAEDALVAAAGELGIQVEKRVEVTLATGRADAVFNRFVVEWEPPGAMGEKPERAGNLHAVEQVQSYVDGLAQKERREVSRLAGVACDGHFMIFARYREGRWAVDRPVPVDAQSAAFLLESMHAAQAGRALTAENLLDDFAGERALAQVAIPVLLAQLDKELGHHPDGLPARLFDQWSRAFAVATGVTSNDKAALKSGARNALAKLLGRKASETDPARGLFVIQTYFAIVTKLISTLSLSLFMERAEWAAADLAELPEREFVDGLAGLHRGEPFKQAGIGNVIEADVFTWFLEETPSSVVSGLRDVVARLATFDPTTLEVSPEDSRDLLKDLYQGLLPRPVRHALGQYFTPDWLAEITLDSVRYEGGREERVLDPACGTGTFLVMAIGRLKRAMAAEGAKAEEIAAAAIRNLVGFDIDPLAVVAARVNYVLALGPLASALPTDAEIPVYRADSILSPTLLDMRQVDRLELDTAVGTFSLPLCVDTAEELRAVCDLATSGLDAGWKPAEYAKQAGEVCAATEGEREVLERFFAECARLHTESIDGIWTRVMRNAFMPAFLGRFDLIVGNPPWVNWEGLPDTYRERTRHLWDDAGLFVHKGMDALLGKGKKDVSMLMAYVVSEQLLAEYGRLGFVMPETLFKTAGAGQGFRRFRFGAGESGTPFRVVGVHDMVDLKPFTGATNRTAVLAWERDAATQYPVAYTVWQRRTAKGIHRHALPSEVEEATRRLPLEAAPVRAADPTSAWLTLPRRLLGPMRKLAEVGEPDYVGREGVNSGGANGVYWIETSGAPDKNGLVPVSNLHDVGKKTLPKRYGAVEPELIHPLVRGSDVSRWSAIPSASILFVQDPESKRGISPDRMADEYPGAWRFLSQFEQQLRRRAAFKRYFTREVGGKKVETGPYWSMFNVGDYTLAPNKVVWKDIAGDFAAAVIEASDPLALPTHTVMLVACESADEAHYVCGALNSMPARTLIAAYVATHISTHTTQVVHVPQFDPADSDHTALAEASRAAHAAIAAGEDPDQGAVDRAASALWDIGDDELKLVRDFHASWLKRDLAGS